MYSLSLDFGWAETQGIRAVGVGKRDPWGYGRLNGIVTYGDNVEAYFDLPFPAPPDLVRRQYEIPDTILVESQIPEDLLELGGESRVVSIEVEYGAPPTRFGQVQQHQPMRVSQPPPQNATCSLQPGDFVAGEDPVGIRRGPGTLSLIASHRGDTKPVVLGAAHVLGRKGYKVVSGNLTSKYVGEVIDRDTSLDVAVAEVYEPWMVDCRVKHLNVVPAAYTPGWSGMAVQMVGRLSGHQMGWMDQPVHIPASSRRAGVVHHHLVTITSQPGDSGALLLSGHGNASPVADPTYADPAQIKSTTCAVLGILVYGPSATPAPTTRPQTFFTPITHALSHFGLELEEWVRAI
jgi:hypothetical protein